jgi:hypothetical protein
MLDDIIRKHIAYLRSIAVELAIDECEYFRADGNRLIVERKYSVRINCLENDH